MIRVRYQGSNELSPGLHATAEREGRRTTVYLLDGMTVAQRRSALRRLRLTARMGHCPRLPAAQLAFALFTDRIRTGIGRAGAVLRLHPAGSTVPIMVLSGGAIAFLLFSTVSIHVLRPRPAGQSALGTSPVVSASPVATGFGSQGQAVGPGGAGNPGDPGGIGAQAAPGGLGSGSDPRQLTQPNTGPGGTTPALAAGGAGAGTGAGSASGSASGSGSGSASGSGRSGSGSGSTSTSGKSSGGTTLSGGSNPSQVTSKQSPPATSAPAPAPASTAPATTPAQSGSGSSSGTQSNGVCVNVGPLGVCLNI
jgi:hypothetical protein